MRSPACVSAASATWKMPRAVGSEQHDGDLQDSVVRGAEAARLDVDDGVAVRVRAGDRGR
jgi:hypothetical protein